MRGLRARGAPVLERTNGRGVRSYPGRPSTSADRSPLIKTHLVKARSDMTVPVAPVRLTSGSCHTSPAITMMEAR